jgi:hypothetical protein
VNWAESFKKEEITRGMIERKLRTKPYNAFREEESLGELEQRNYLIKKCSLIR